MSSVITGSSFKLLLATRNPGKRREIADLLSDLPIETVYLAQLSPLPDCEEDGATFMENAVKKARHYYRLTGIPTLADDSGLVVDALGGRPGVRSARFAGPAATDAQRVEKILELMRGVPESGRQAAFVCALAYSWEPVEVYKVEEYAAGMIAGVPAGANGFGYDPIFLVPELGKTFAQLEPLEKSRISHRGKALAQFRNFLISRFFDQRITHEA